MPPLSGITNTSATPQAASAAKTRNTMLARSAICRLAALATTRLMSRAETGLAMMPMVGRTPTLLAGALALQSAVPDVWLGYGSIDESTH
jgi:hypothetical protein